MSKNNRIQTTVNISSDAVDALNELSRASTVSRSRLVDLALRRFIRWAEPVSPKDLKLIADYEVSEPTAGFMRRRTTTIPPAPINGDDEDDSPDSIPPDTPRAKPVARPEVIVRRPKGGRPPR